MRRAIRFLRRGQVVELGDIEPTEMLLDHLRLREGACGTKEGCAEGDCGACTVALGRLVDGKLVYEPVNSCIFLTGMADGADVVAVDDLAPDGAPLHPVQQAMVDYHGSQCGFCTPGFVMSLFTLYQSGIRPDRKTVNDWLAGNLCRCTGYRPIVDAALAACDGRPADSHARKAAATAATLAGLGDSDDLFVGDEQRFFAAPASRESLAALYATHPDATLVAGATDVGLWVTKQLRDLPKIIHLGRVAGLDAVEDQPDALVIGAGATYSQAEARLAAIDPDIAELLRRLGRAEQLLQQNLSEEEAADEEFLLAVAYHSVGHPSFRELGEHLYLVEDTCNVYLLTGPSGTVAVDFGVYDLRVRNPATSNRFGELAPYGICWFDALPASDAARWCGPSAQARCSWLRPWPYTSACCR